MHYPGSGFLLGTPTPGQPLSKLEDQLFAEVQEQVEVKLSRDGEDLQVLTRSGGRCDKERSMRRRKLKKLWSLVDVRLPQPRQEVSEETFGLSLNIGKLRKARRSEGTYLLRTNLTAGNPEELWKQYIVLTEVEQALKELKNDLDIRPVYHQKDERIEAHIFVSFLSYCLQVTLKQRAKAKAPGLTPRAILEKFKSMQMIDVHLPTTDGRNLILPRYTQPEKDLLLLLH